MILCGAVAVGIPRPLLSNRLEVHARQWLLKYVGFKIQCLTNKHSTFPYPYTGLQCKSKNLAKSSKSLIFLH